MYGRNTAMIRRRQWRARQKNNKSRPRSRNSGRPKPKSTRKKGRNTGANKHKSKASGKLKYSGREKAEQEAAKQQPQAETRRALASTPSLSREGIPEHTYELLQDYTVNIGTGVSVLDAASVTMEEFSLITLK